MKVVGSGANRVGQLFLEPEQAIAYYRRAIDDAIAIAIAIREYPQSSPSASPSSSPSSSPSGRPATCGRIGMPRSWTSPTRFMMPGNVSTSATFVRVAPLVLAAAKTLGPGGPTDLACAACHTEHQGRDFDLKRMGDQQCQACHQAQFASFASGHPEFTGYPYVRRTRMQFDHVSHWQKQQTPKRTKHEDDK